MKELFSAFHVEEELSGLWNKQNTLSFYKEELPEIPKQL